MEAGQAACGAGGGCEQARLQAPVSWVLGARRQETEQVQARLPGPYPACLQHPWVLQALGG